MGVVRVWVVTVLLWYHWWMMHPAPSEQAPSLQHDTYINTITQLTTTADTEICCVIRVIAAYVTLKQTISRELQQS